MSNKSTGNLFVNDYKKTDKHPDYTGYLELTKEQITDLIAVGKAGGEIKIQLGCWEYPSKRNANQNRYFIVAETGKEEAKKTDDWANDPF